MKISRAIAIQSLSICAGLILVAAVTVYSWGRYEQAQADSHQWKQVAQTALNRGREDLAQAALYKRRDAQNKADTIKQQLQELSDLQISIETDQALALKRLSEASTVH